MAISLITELARDYDFQAEQFKPQIVEEYLIKYGKRKGEIDVPYLCRRERISHNSVRNEIQKVFGKQKFDFKSTKNEVSKTSFMDIYEFGLYPNVREWIGHSHRSGKGILTRKKLFQFLTEDNVDMRWEVQPNDYFV